MLRLLAFGLVLTSGGVGGWAWWPKADNPAAARAEAFAENGEEGAEYRWRTNQSRHWRYVVTAR